MNAHLPYEINTSYSIRHTLCYSHAQNTVRHLPNSGCPLSRRAVKGFKVCIRRSGDAVLIACDGVLVSSTSCIDHAGPRPLSWLGSRVPKHKRGGWYNIINAVCRPTPSTFTNNKSNNTASTKTSASYPVTGTQSTRCKEARYNTAIYELACLYSW